MMRKIVENDLLNHRNAIKSVIYTILPFIALSFILNYYYPTLDKKTFFIGLICSVCNFYVILWAWSRIFLKKRIALAIGVIVIKYAILGITIYKVVSAEHLNILSFLIGMFSLFILIICYSVLQDKAVN